jgi:hypothetical protein
VIFPSYQHNPVSFFFPILAVALCDNNTSHQPTSLVITFMVAHWFTSNEAALIEFLITHKAEVGDGFNFKDVTWTAAAAHMVAYTERGDPKTAGVCKNKWARVCTGVLPFQLVLISLYS